MATHRVFIVEDHQVMRAMLQEFLETAPDITVSGVASNAEEALEMVPDTEVDLLLIDVSLPGMSGIELTQQVAEQWPEISCLIFSAHDEISYARRALSAGAQGYVLKGNPSELITAMQEILAGEVYVSPTLHGRLSRNKQQQA